jgi:uncharacterized repeat protein (TIGR03803 family)
MNVWTRTALFFGCAGLAGCAQGAMSGGAAGGAGLSALPMLRSGAPLQRVKHQTSSSDPTLYLFGGEPDGATPFAGVINAGGTLYGTTYYGGTNNLGAIFSLTTAGREQVIHNFAGSDGEYPSGSLLDVNGTLYGTTSAGVGSAFYGCIFSITPAGKYSVVYSFKAPPDGDEPASSLVEYKGALYGTTEGGGEYSYGTVFEVPISGKKAGKESVVYSFKGAPDGARPMSALVRDGNAFYGTTNLGGANNGGIAFSVTESGKEKVLHSFSSGGSGPDGSQPPAGLLDYKGTFYGTTTYGGTSDWGTIFSITKAGKEKVLVAFGADGSANVGSNPVGPLTNIGGAFYGTTEMSSPRGTGTVFSMTPSGNIHYVTVFCVDCGKDSGYPVAPESSVIEVGKTLYGTSVDSVGGAGTVWAIAP